MKSIGTSQNHTTNQSLNTSATGNTLATGNTTTLQARRQSINVARRRNAEQNSSFSNVGGYFKSGPRNSTPAGMPSRFVSNSTSRNLFCKVLTKPLDISC